MSRVEYVVCDNCGMRLTLACLHLEREGELRVGENEGPWDFCDRACLLAYFTDSQIFREPSAKGS